MFYHSSFLFGARRRPQGHGPKQPHPWDGQEFRLAALDASTSSTRHWPQTKGAWRGLRPWSWECWCFFHQHIGPFVIYGVANASTGQALACRHGFLKKQGQPEHPVLTDFSLHQRCASAMKIGSTFIQVTSRRGKAMSVANRDGNGSDSGRIEQLPARQQRDCR
jgi:hypothetical protein